MDKYSRGCQLCQQGKWLCIFLTYKCNGGCQFCPAPFKHDLIHSSFGNSKEAIAFSLKKGTYEGISFSGGDPFMVYDRLLEWLIFFKGTFPHYYFWVYTHGVNVTSKKLEQLARAGMNEIRFNIAATGYLSSDIFKKIRLARKFFPFVSIEIPSIKEDHHLLVTALAELDQIGIDFLNLHDYILTDSGLKKDGQTFKIFKLNKTIPIRYATSSPVNTKQIINLCKTRNYSFQINHCSMEQKEYQMLQRRITFGKIFLDDDYDFLLEDGLLYNFYSFPHEVFNEGIKEKFFQKDFRSYCIEYLVKKERIKQLLISENRTIKVCYSPQIEINQEKIFLQADLFDNRDLNEFISRYYYK